MNEMLQQFLIESRELAEHAIDDVLALQQAPQDAELLDAVLRALHTLKGSAGIVEFHEMEQAVHAAEDVLASARRHRDAPGAQVLQPTLACLDQVVEWLDAIQRTGDLPAGTTTRPHAADSTEEAAARVADSLPAEARDVLAAQLDIVEAEVAPAPGHLASAAATAANTLRHCGRGELADQLAALAAAPSADDLRHALRKALAQTTAAALPGAPASGKVASTAAAARTLRVPAERIDALVRLTGELTVASNALAHLSRLAVSEGNPLAAQIKGRNAAFEQLTAELQRSVLALRVMPLRAVLQRFPRLLQEIAGELGKAVQLKTVGEDTEADKAIVEALFEPLLHVVRNAVDHGVESAALRASAGKSATATIEIRAQRQGDQVLVDVADDGAGMNVQRMREVALERGVVTAEALDSMSDAEVIDLAFAPGFSTASAVTHLSGRGVGMDVVRNAIERLGGRVSIQSQSGSGTTVRFTLPFSVMMTTVMSVQAGGQMFGVPLDNVVEVVRVPRSQVSAVGAARAVVLRDQTIPVIDLSQMLGGNASVHADSDVTIVITSLAGQRCGVEVEQLGEHLDVILKPLEGLIADTPGVSGTTVLGDGRVLLVLDIGRMLQ